MGISRVHGLQRGRDVPKVTGTGSSTVAIVDWNMPKLDGIAFLERHREEGIEGLVLMTTAYGSMDIAVQAMKQGAYDYLPKPFGADEVLLTIRKAEERESLRQEVGRLRSEVRADAQRAHAKHRNVK